MHVTASLEKLLSIRPLVIIEAKQIITSGVLSALLYAHQRVDRMHACYPLGVQLV
jgi:hypothetical protein